MKLVCNHHHVSRLLLRIGKYCDKVEICFQGELNQVYLVLCAHCNQNFIH